TGVWLNARWCPEKIPDNLLCLVPWRRTSRWRGRRQVAGLESAGDAKTDHMPETGAGRNLMPPAPVSIPGCSAADQVVSQPVAGLRVACLRSFDGLSANLPPSIQRDQVGQHRQLVSLDGAAIRTRPGGSSFVGLIAFQRVPLSLSVATLGPATFTCFLAMFT